MAEKQYPQQDYVFKEVDLIKNDTLGTGSYGAVCKAKCDQLICAAKLLYPVLFQIQTSIPGKEHRRPFRRFEIECQFLSRINHPDIVQYLGTNRDPETNAPVLLMELMDQSLTHFLESSLGDVPYHTQINLSEDVAQALAFLHSNGIIHRDLSSNNVLLLASTRAKVTDFGMSKFTDLNATRLATMTMCPGTPAFMSPEALNEQPVYTEKLDNFSFGVLLVQIATRQFPKPTDRFKIRELFDHRFPNQIILAKVPVPELERRQAHINMIPPAHLLLPTALHCLRDSDSERPTATQLCQTLNALKRTARYQESSQRDLHQLLREKNTQLLANEETLKQKNSELQEQLVAKNMENDQLVTRLDQATQDNNILRHVIQRNETTIAHKNERLLENEKQFQPRKNTVECKNEQQQTKDTHRKISTRLEQAIQDRHILNQDNHSLRQKLSARDEQLRILQEELHLSEKNCAALKRDKEISELRESLASKNEQLLTTRIHHIALQDEKQTSTRPVTVGRWQSLPTLPAGVWYGSSAVIKDKAYFKSNENTVYEFSNNLWKKLPLCPNVHCTIVSIDDMLTAIGGEGKLFPCNKLYKFTDNQWIKHFPPMPTGRCNPTAVYANSTLVVAGGQTTKLLINTVEILNTVNRQWSSVSSLPEGIDCPSATICRDYVYIHSRKIGSKQNLVYKCSLEKLVLSQPCAAIWEEITSLSVSYSSFITVNGHLLSVGGEEANGDYTTNIHQYMNTSWTVVGHMQYPRSGALTATLLGNKLMVVGGGGAFRKSEIATIE